MSGIMDTATKTLPVLVKSMEHMKVENVSCGSSHTAVIVGASHTIPSITYTEGGKVYTFGAGSYGRLGLGSTSGNLSSPCRVNELEWGKAVQISCGVYHAAVLIDNRKS